MAFPFMQLLANSLIIGSIYSLVAVGFTLIYSTNRFMHFGHGAAVVVAGYIAFFVFAQIGLPFWLAVITTLFMSGLLGYLVHRLLYVPLKKKKSSNVILLIASVAVLLLFENLTLLIWGADVKTFGLIKVAKGMNIAGAIITPLQITIIIVSIVLFIGLWLLMNKTKLGRDLRAVADHPELAQIMGINAKKMMALSFIIGSVLAGVAGVLIGLEQNLEPSMGSNLMVKGFSGAVIGGITSVPASIVGSYLVGIAENFGIWWLPSGWKDAITFSLLFVFLLFRPQGLFGKHKEARS